MKSIKNETELNGFRNAMVKDGVALVKFYMWLEKAVPAGEVNEVTVEEKLLEFRSQQDLFVGESFGTIAGYGRNGAVIHYHAVPETCLKVKPEGLLLIDSGGQYKDGTTDITRTVWIGPGEPDALLKDRFTRVLKGHIALALAVFPKGTLGSQLDSFARQHLWQAGLDYMHGTGHGVGSFLSVHEGPQRIAKASGGQAGTEQELLPGMILSNEPGYYKNGHYGIRLENLEIVREAYPIEGGEREMMGFETLTLVPFDRRCVVKPMLTGAERDWLDRYHARVLKVIGPHLGPDDRAWLEKACAPL